MSPRKVLGCLARIGLGQLEVVVAEADDPLVLDVVGAVQFLGLFSNQVLLDFSALVVGRPMVVDSRVVSQPSTISLLLISASRKVVVSTCQRLLEVSDISPLLLEHSHGVGGGGSSTGAGDASAAGSNAGGSYHLL